MKGWKAADVAAMRCVRDIAANRDKVGITATNDEKKRAKWEPKIVALPPSFCDDKSITLMLQMPAMALRNNGGNDNRWVIRKAKEAAHEEAKYAVFMVTKCKRLMWPAARLSIRVVQSKRPFFDRQNVEAMLKAHIDGACRDAGLVVNDRFLDDGPITFDVDRTCPHIEMTFERIERG